MSTPSSPKIRRKLRVCFWWYLLGFTHDCIVWRHSWPAAELISNAFLRENIADWFLFHMISESGACVGCGWCSTSKKLEFHGLSSVVWADACRATSPPVINIKSNRARMAGDETATAPALDTARRLVGDDPRAQQRVWRRTSLRKLYGYGYTHWYI